LTAIGGGHYHRPVMGGIGLELSAWESHAAQERKVLGSLIRKRFRKEQL
jgi:hypothetical protein